MDDILGHTHTTEFRQRGRLFTPQCCITTILNASYKAQKLFHHHRPFVPGALTNIFSLLEPGLFSPRAGVSRFFNQASINTKIIHLHQTHISNVFGATSALVSDFKIQLE